MSEHVYTIAKTLYEDIVLGIFPTGNKLAEERLAERFEVKRHTIREVLAQLEEIGFVERVPNRGVFVREMTPSEVKETYEVRTILESHAALITPLPAEPSLIKELEKIHKRISKAIDTSDYRAVLHLNTEFHRVQFSACMNTTLVTAIADYAVRVHAITAMKYGDREVMLKVIGHHQEIIEALSNKDNLALVDIVKRHFNLKRVDEYRQRYQMRYGLAEPEVQAPRRLRFTL